MNHSTTAQSHVVDLVSAIERYDESAGLPVRLIKLLTTVFEHWAEQNTNRNLASLTDSELLQKLASSAAVASASSTREILKQERRIAAKIEFYENLTRFGGVLKSQAVANILGVSRQTINNHVNKGTLIAIQDGGDFLYPAFQFVNNGKLPYLEEVLKTLGATSGEAKCTFFLNPINLEDGKAELPYILLRNGAIPLHLNAIKKEAACFMNPS